MARRTIEEAQTMVNEDGMTDRVSRVSGTRSSAVVWRDFGPLGERSIVIADGQAVGLRLASAIDEERNRDPIARYGLQ